MHDLLVKQISLRKKKHFKSISKLGHFVQKDVLCTYVNGIQLMMKNRRKGLNIKFKRYAYLFVCMTRKNRKVKGKALAFYKCPLFQGIPQRYRLTIIVQ
jgi:hypothetical protein